MKELQDKRLALKMMDEAEKLKQLSTDYKLQGEFNKADLAPVLTPTILFGMSAEDKAQTYQVLILQLEEEVKAETAKAKKCLEGVKQVKNPQQAESLKGIAKKSIDSIKDIKAQI